MPGEHPERKAFDYAAAAATIYDPDATVTNDPPVTPPGADPDPAPAPPAFEPPPEPPAPPALTETPPAPEATPAAPAEEPPAGKTRSLRFASHDEAERGYSNLFAEKQRLAEELNKIRQADEARQKAEYDGQVAAVRREQMSTFLRERSKQHQKAMAELDPNDPGYDDAVADLEANYQLDLDGFRANPPQVPEDRLPTPPAAPSAPADPADPLADPARFVAGELGRHGLEMKDPFVRHLAGTLPQVGTRLEDGRTVTLPLQMEMLVDRLSTETLGRYCQQSSSPDLPGLEISHPVLQHFVRQVPTVDAAGKTVPFYARMQQAVRDTRKWQSEERRKLLAQAESPLPQNFGPGPALRNAAPGKPTSLGSVLDRVLEQSRIR